MDENSAVVASGFNGANDAKLESSKNPIAAHQLVLCPSARLCAVHSRTAAGTCSAASGEYACESDVVGRLKEHAKAAE